MLSDWPCAAYSVLSSISANVQHFMQHQQGCSGKQGGCLLPCAGCTNACSVPRLLWIRLCAMLWPDAGLTACNAHGVLFQMLFSSHLQGHFLLLVHMIQVQS